MKIAILLLPQRQPHVNKDTDTHENILFLPTGSMVTVQHKDGGCWTHGTVVRHTSYGDHGKSYRIRVLKMGYIISRTDRHVKTTPITVEEYLENEVVKKDKTVGENRVDKLVDHYTKLYENEKPDKLVTINYQPMLITPDIEPLPLPSAKRIKWIDRNLRCHDNNIREHTWTHV